MIKAQAGALLSGLGKAFSGASSIIGGGTGILKGATSVAKGAQTLATINKVAGYGQQALNIGKNIMGGMQPTVNTPSVQPGITQGTAIDTATVNPVTGAPTATVMNTRVTPTLQPMGGTPVRQPGMQQIKPIAAKLISGGKGTKLKAEPMMDKKKILMMKK